MTQGAVWVTGADGFVGRRVLARLAARGQPAAALVMDPAAAQLGVPCGRLQLAELALADPGTARLGLDELPEPAALLHLAAMAFPPDCEAHPDAAFAVNAVGPARLYEALFARWPRLRVLHVSTGQVYRPAAVPIDETAPAVPVNVYGASKLQGEAVALGWFDRGAAVSVARPFNHSGPGQAAAFALPSFALRLAALEMAGGGALEVGNLDGVRDFLHVDTVADVYLDLLDSAGKEPLLNVCSGTGRRMSELLDGLLARTHAGVELRTRAERLRGAGDADHLVGDPTRLASVLGRRPQLDAGALLDELMTDARIRVAAGEDVTRA
ncbi:MAG TPA: NAD-dependent epimerase/dehydratase family protein [Planctomycetota bacterium]